MRRDGRKGEIGISLRPRGGCAMLLNESEQVRECVRRAEECARQAKAQTNPKFQQDFLDLERRWLRWPAATNAPVEAAVISKVGVTPEPAGKAVSPEVSSFL